MPSDSELRMLFDRSPVGMYRSTADGRFLFVNAAIARMLGYTVEELLQINLNTQIYVDPSARERLIEAYSPRSVVDGAEVEWKTRDGRVLTVQIWGHVIDGEHGQSFDASVLDVTELRQQREDLERTATTLDLVVRQMPAVYWLVDHDLRVLRTGGAVQSLLGYAPDRFIGRTLYDAHAEDPSSADPIAIHKRALTGEITEFENEYRGKLLANTIGPHRNAAGDIIGAIGTCIDVTAARLLERRMVDAQRAESLGVLAGGLAHDFNNLLVAVIGNADLALREIPLRAPGRAAIENMRDAGLRAAELTDQLLAYAGRAGTGTTGVEPALVVEELLRIVAPSIPSDVAITVDLPADLTLRGDPTQVRQVLLNLVTNARDALTGRAGSIVILGRALEHDGRSSAEDVLTAPEGSYVMLDVSDDGPGMTSETLRHVFEPFFTTKQTGHGLGLAAVLGIVRAHGGGIRVISSLGGGARFQILWPASSQQRAASPHIARRTVLVIDDEDLVRDVVARMIEDLGYAALTARDGVAGLEVVAQQTVDAVFVDLTMPNMGGAEVIARLRASRPGLPIVLCSGFDRDGHGPVKADAYLPKPFRIEALERMLAKLLV